MGRSNLAFLQGGGEMGARMRALDWSKSPLGPIGAWPQSLRSTVSMLLPSKAQIIVFWGPEFVVLYNDAYRPVFGAKHPLALGLPAYVLIKVLHPSFFAREDTKRPMVFAAISMALNVVLSFALFMAVGGTGIAIATTLSGWVNVGLLVACLEGRGEFALDATFRRALLGILGATVSMGGALLAIARLLEPYFAPEHGIPAQAAALLALVAGGLLIYLAAAELFGAAKWRNLLKDIRAH